MQCSLLKQGLTFSVKKEDQKRQMQRSVGMVHRRFTGRPHRIPVLIEQYYVVRVGNHH